MNEVDRKEALERQLLSDICSHVTLGAHEVWAWMYRDGCSSDFHGEGIPEGLQGMVRHKQAESFDIVYRREGLTRLLQAAYEVGKLDAAPIAAPAARLFSGKANCNRGIAVPFTLQLGDVQQARAGNRSYGPYVSDDYAIRGLVEAVGDYVAEKAYAQGRKDVTDYLLAIAGEKLQAAYEEAVKEALELG